MLDVSRAGWFTVAERSAGRDPTGERRRSLRKQTEADAADVGRQSCRVVHCRGEECRTRSDRRGVVAGTVVAVSTGASAGMLCGSWPALASRGLLSPYPIYCLYCLKLHRQHQPSSTPARRRSLRKQTEADAADVGRQSCRVVHCRGEECRTRSDRRGVVAGTVVAVSTGASAGMLCGSRPALASRGLLSPYPIYCLYCLKLHRQHQPSSTPARSVFCHCHAATETEELTETDGGRRCRRWTSVVPGGSLSRRGVQDAIRQERSGCRDGCGGFNRRFGRHAVWIPARPC
ncbi:hypothetical protein NDU88_003597 [Pleurodeles waltl]|uniref:Uncharacterized protein n=1 Tax=Pleurodeles waltl TaxID=8319 RepID=A0AAV7KWZ2_PLEWA|nr:hypothetical protein NDU88_003597 [Pleurodeles waltl]